MKKWVFIAAVLVVCAAPYLYARLTEVFPIEDRKYYLSQYDIRYETIATPTSSGVTGDITYDANYVYVCVAPNTWKRYASTTWAVAGDTMLYENDIIMLYENGDTMVYD